MTSIYVGDVTRFRSCRGYIRTREWYVQCVCSWDMSCECCVQCVYGRGYVRDTVMSSACVIGDLYERMLCPCSACVVGACYVQCMYGRGYIRGNVMSSACVVGDMYEIMLCPVHVWQGLCTRMLCPAHV